MAGPMPPTVQFQVPQGTLPVSGDLGVLTKGLQAVQASVEMLLDEAGAISRGKPVDQAGDSTAASTLSDMVQPAPSLNASSQAGILKRLAALEKENTDLQTRVKTAEGKERQSEQDTVKLRTQLQGLKKKAVFLHKGAHKHKSKDNSDSDSDEDSNIETKFHKKTTTEMVTTTTEMPTTTAKAPEKEEDGDESDSDE